MLAEQQRLKTQLTNELTEETSLVSYGSRGVLPSPAHASSSKKAAFALDRDSGYSSPLGPPKCAYIPDGENAKISNKGKSRGGDDGYVSPLGPPKCAYNPDEV